MRSSVERVLIRQFALLVYDYMMRTRDLEIARIFNIEDRFKETKEPKS